MNYGKFLLFFLMFFSTLTTVKADILLEPYYGLLLNSKDDDGDPVSGSLYGGRLGYQMMGFMLGLDARLGALKIDSTADTDLTLTQYSAFVGYNFPVLVRVWASAGLAGEAKVTNGGTFEKVGGSSLGIGYTGLPFLSINLEMINQTYSDFKPVDIGEADLQLFLLSISLPFTL